MEFKCRDRSPEMTISTIKDIFEREGIKITEYPMKVSFNQFYSVRINIEQTGDGANGKGISYQYALASAYAELLERIGNGVIKIPWIRYKNNCRTCGINDVFDPKSDNDLVNDVLSVCYEDRNVLVGLWKKLNKNDGLTGENYTEVNSNKECFLPYLLNTAYGSNGMAVGNSYEEAFVQASCEIFERYVAKIVINGEIVPPDIPMEYIRNRYPRIVRYIDSIEQDGRYSVIIKECSLNQGFPVVALCLIDREKGQGIIKFGSHPKLNIAIERVFVETFQGKSIEELPITLRYDMESFLGESNNLDFILNGCGFFSPKFLDGTSDYKFSDRHYDVGSKDNRQLYERVRLFLQEKKLKVFQKINNSFKLPIIHLIIPGMSVMFPQSSVVLRYRIMRLFVLKRIGEFMSLSISLQKSIIFFLDYSRKVSYGRSVMKELFRPVIWIEAYKFSDVGNLFVLYGYLFLGLDKKALMVIQSMFRHKMSKFEKKYFKAMQYYIFNSREVRNSLHFVELLYGKEVVDLVKVTTSKQWFSEYFVLKALRQGTEFVRCFKYII